MRVPLSWLVELVPGLVGVDARDVAGRLTRAGLAVEGLETTGGDVRGVVVGEVVSFQAEPQQNGKTVRWCQVRVVDGGPMRGIVCGAANFEPGDRVPVALPGAVLPGDFVIGARKTYGHLSDGMICSARELGAGDEAGGILVLSPQTPLGVDVAGVLGLQPETVLDVAVTPDRGYALSLRGIARECATAFGLPFTDPVALPMVAGCDQGYPVRIEDPTGCDRYVARAVSGLRPEAVTPPLLQRRIVACGMRPVSPAVDVTNLILLGLGQPLHAFDAERVQGSLVVRRARRGERLLTLDRVDRALDPEDLVIADDTGPVALAGVMGGAATEVGPATTSVLFEAAHFDPVVIRRAAARHALPSEASRRFERGVDHALAPAAAQAAVDLLVDVAGGHAEPGGTDIDVRRPRPSLTLPIGAAGAKAGRDYAPAVVRSRLLDVGCAVRDADAGGDADAAGVLVVEPPSWRPDLVGAAELIEEVVRLEGYETIPSVLPRARPGRGLRRAQRAQRAVGLALAEAGHVEVVSTPFVSRDDLETLLSVAGSSVIGDDPRSHASELANPQSDEAALLRTTLLPGLLRAIVRNTSRGNHDLALFEVGSVFLPGPAGRPPAPDLTAERRPTEAELAGLEAALPAQPRHVGVVLAGMRVRASWNVRQPQQFRWSDAVEAARVAAHALGVTLRATPAELAPWHPGRCAELSAGGVVIGTAGELHPRVVAHLGLPPGACAAELDLDALVAAAVDTPVRAPIVSPYPAVSRDVALVVAADIAAADVEDALRDGAGELLETLRLFDSYAGEALGECRRSLAFRLVLRSSRRTLTDSDANDARDAAVAAAAERTGAVLRT